jgi:solute carrier family 25 (mitochondrial thiamine pyrophosphate transporter), member 19
MQGLWRGTVPGLLLTVPYTAVQFLALYQIRDAAANMGLTGKSLSTYHGYDTSSHH